MNPTLYKYRGIGEFKNFVDIVLNNRLFAASYLELNDPMEGHYLYRDGELNGELRGRLRHEKNNLRICALSRVRDHQLMWAHYSEGNKGVCIGVIVNRNHYDVRPIIYDGMAYIRNQNFNNDTAIEILSHKHEIWGYEEEERVFVHQRNFIEVEVVQVIAGSRMSTQNFGLIREMLDRINPRIQFLREDQL